MMNLRALADADIAHALAAASGRAADAPDVQAAAAASNGSVARGLMLLEGDALGLFEAVGEILTQLPNLDELALHRLADAMGPADRIALTILAERVDQWLGEKLHHEPRRDLHRLARLSQVWEKVTQSMRDAQIYNLERKPLVFSVFDLLRDCA